MMFADDTQTVGRRLSFWQRWLIIMILRRKSRRSGATERAEQTCIKDSAKVTADYIIEKKIAKAETEFVEGTHTELWLFARMRITDPTSASQAASKQASLPASQLASQIDIQQASQTDIQPASQPASQSASFPASQLPSHPAS